MPRSARTRVSSTCVLWGFGGERDMRPWFSNADTIGKRSSASSLVRPASWTTRCRRRMRSDERFNAPHAWNLWCPGPESNRHALRRGILSPLRLPISPPGLGGRERVQVTAAGDAKTAIICGLWHLVRRGPGGPVVQGAGRGQHTPDAHPLYPYFFSGRNQFITSAQIPPVATPDSSTLFTECGRCDRISGTCDTPNPSAKDTAMMSSARRSS